MQFIVLVYDEGPEVCARVWINTRTLCAALSPSLSLSTGDYVRIKITIKLLLSAVGS